MPAPPPEVFISYSSTDEDFKDALVTHLEVLKLQNVFSNIWHDGSLVPGQQWHQEIIQHLNSSHVILLLISPKFLTSGYVNNIELKNAAKRHKAGEVCVVPVLVRNVSGWKGHPFGSLKLGALQAVPDNEKFLGDIDHDKRDREYAEISDGIQKAIKTLKDVIPDALTPANLPAPPVVDFVARKGRDNRDIIERLKEELSPPNQRLIALIGEGGVGKTTLAAEAVRALGSVFAGRIVWASAEKSAGFAFSTLLDEIASQLGQKELSKLAPDKKEEAVRTLIAPSPTLIVLDNFETVSTKEQKLCEAFLSSGLCAAIITSRQRVDAARPLYIDAMKPDEASEFLEKLVAQMSDPAVFSDDVRRRIIETADARPYVVQWITAQIDQEAQEPEVILNELSRGKGDAAERVFDRSFNLPQLGDDGRITLLALSLFVPDASREALAAVAGFEGNLERVNGAITNLRSLQLIKARDGNRRLGIEGLTRSLATARLDEDKWESEFRRRSVAHFVEYASKHNQATGEDFGVLDADKDNLFAAMDIAAEREDWESVMAIQEAMTHFLHLRGYWEDAISRGELALQAARRMAHEDAIAHFAHNIAITRLHRGEVGEARRLYDESLAIQKTLENRSGIAGTLHQLARLAQDQGETDEARRLYDESLAIKKQIGDQSGIAITLHNLAALAQDQGDIDEARRLYNESLEIAKMLSDQPGISQTLHQLATLAQLQGEYENARRLCYESLEIKKKLGDQFGIALTLAQLGNLAELEGNNLEAVRLYRESLITFEKLGSPNAEIVRRSLRRVKGESS
jgi:tetratricopeptide (TPR) repeat protein